MEEQWWNSFEFTSFFVICTLKWSETVLHCLNSFWEMTLTFTGELMYLANQKTWYSFLSRESYAKA